MGKLSVKILLIDDNPGDARLIRGILSEIEEFQVQTLWCTRLDEGLRATEKNSFDLVLLDLMLPDSEGRNTIIQANKEISDIPIIVVTGYYDESLALEVVKLGAQDYLLKGHIGSNTLTRCIRYALERHRMRTELARQAEMLRASESNLRNLITQNADGIVVLDKQNKIIFINPSAEKMYGMKKEELVGETFRFPEMKGQRTELSLIRPDKQKVIVEIRVSDTEWKGRKAKLISLRDITRRKQTEEELHILSSRNQALLKAIPDIIMEVDQNKIYTWANAEGYRFFGNDVLGKPADQFVAADQDTMQKVEPLFCGEVETCYLEVWQINQFGEKRLLAWWCRVLRNDFNEIVGALSTARDITEQKLAENLIRSREAILGAVSFAAERLIEANRWEDCIQDVLQELGQAAGVSRTYLFENIVDEKSRLRTSQRFEWVKSGVEAQIGNQALLNAQFDSPGFHLLVDALAHDDIFHCVVSDLNETDRKFFESQAIKSLIVVPIFLENTWWGFLGFDDCEHKREWAQVEVEAIRAGADILAAAIQRKLAEKKLVDSERRFRDISENTSDLIWEMDKRGRFIYVNQIVENILGFKTQEVVGKYVWDFAVPADSDNIKAFIEHVLEHKTPIRDLEAKYQHKNGKSVYLEMNGIPVFDAEQNLKAYRGVNRNFTDRKLKESEQQKENQYELNLEKCIARVSSTLLKSKNLIAAIEQTLEDLAKTMGVCRAYYFQKEQADNYDLRSIGWAISSKSECLKFLETLELRELKNWDSLLKDNIIVKIDDVQKYKSDLKIEKDLLERFKMKSFIAVPIFVQGIFYGLLGCDATREKRKWKLKEGVALRTIAENISRSIERQGVSEQIKSQKIKFESVVKNSSEGIILIDQNHRINLINPAGRTMLRSLACSQKSNQFLKQISDVSIPEIWKELSSENTGFIKKEVVTSSKNKRFFSATFSAVKNVSQKLTGIVINLSDMTESRQTQEKLVQSSKLASLGQLAAGVAHELNNPLTSIMGFTQLSLKERLSPDLRENLEKILKDGKRAQSIVKNMLDFSHRGNSKFEKGNINETIDHALVLMGKQLEVNDIKLVRNFDDNAPLAFYDRGELQQVFLNLIQNTFDAIVNDQVGNFLEIRTKNINGEKIIIHFTDDGPGIPEDVQHRIFDPFFTTKDPGAGTGLGLSISYKIIQKHGGAMTVKSEPGNGTIFTIVLPTRLKEMDEDEYEMAAELFSGAKGKIMLFDDGQERSNIVNMLNCDGHEVVENYDIEDSMKKLADREFDLLIIDLKRLQYIKNSMIEELENDWKNHILFVADFSIGPRFKEKFLEEGILVVSKDVKSREFARVVNQTLKMFQPVGIPD